MPAGRPIGAALGLGAFALAVFAGATAAQQTGPQEISVSDLIQGYVGEDITVVAKGHMAYVNGQALLNPSLPSAMLPVIVEIAGLPIAMQDELRNRCAASKITGGGCPVKVEGIVQRVDGRAGLLATQIDLLDP